MRCTVVALVLLTACGGGTDIDLTVESGGGYPVGLTQRVVLRDGTQDPVPLLILYPADPATVGGSIAVQELAPEPERSTYADLLAAADASCPTRFVSGSIDAALASGTFPLVVFSHCHECTSFSGLAIAHRLANHGFVVVAPEHTGNTLWNQLDDDGAPLDTQTLELRVRDLEGAVAAVRDDAFFRDSLDAHLGVFGHSFGSVTAGLYAQRNGADAVFGLAAPMENPLLPGVTITELAAPLGFLVAREDNSISELGNELIRGNFMRATGRAWKIEVADAGHWSVSDLVGVVPAFAPGCGAGMRQTDGQPFTYLPAEMGRHIAASYVTAFFKATLLGEAGAATYLETARPAGTVTVDHR